MERFHRFLSIGDEISLLLSWDRAKDKRVYPNFSSLNYEVKNANNRTTTHVQIIIEI